MYEHEKFVTILYDKLPLTCKIKDREFKRMTQYNPTSLEFRSQTNESNDWPLVFLHELHLLLRGTYVCPSGVDCHLIHSATLMRDSS